MPVNVGIHNYFATPQGWSNAKLNGVHIQEQVKTNGYMKLNKTNKIELEHNRYQWDTSGFNEAVLWSGEIRTHLILCVCIEPVHTYSHSIFTDNSKWITTRECT